MQPIPPGVELQSSVESNDERADEEKSHISNTASWVWSAGGQRDSVMLDADSPDNPRLSRMSTMDNIASEEEVALEMEKVVETDKKAGVTRPPNYTKLGSKLPFRIARTPEVCIRCTLVAPFWAMAWLMRLEYSLYTESSSM